MEGTAKIDGEGINLESKENRANMMQLPSPVSLHQYNRNIPTTLKLRLQAEIDISLSDHIRKIGWDLDGYLL